MAILRIKEDGVWKEIPALQAITSYPELKNLPSINGVELIGDKTTEDLGIVGSSMTEIEISTDIANPTEILNYIGASGTYVAKNTGVLGNEGEPMVILAKGQYFSISNLQEMAKELGIELPDSENFIDIKARTLDGEEITVRIYGNGNVEQLVWLNSENVSDYVNVTSEVAQVLRNAINYNYGMQMSGNYVTFVSASNYEIDNANNQYRVITPTNIKYAIQKWGAEYFTTKDEHSQLKENVDTLKTEIETILESVVTIDE